MYAFVTLFQPTPQITNISKNYLQVHLDSTDGLYVGSGSIRAALNAPACPGNQYEHGSSLRFNCSFIGSLSYT